MEKNNVLKITPNNLPKDIRKINRYNTKKTSKSLNNFYFAKFVIIFNFLN